MQAAGPAPAPEGRRGRRRDPNRRGLSPRSPPTRSDPRPRGATHRAGGLGGLLRGHAQAVVQLAHLRLGHALQGLREGGRAPQAGRLQQGRVLQAGGGGRGLGPGLAPQRPDPRVSPSPPSPPGQPEAAIPTPALGRDLPTALTPRPSRSRPAAANSPPPARVPEPRAPEPRAPAAPSPIGGCAATLASQRRPPGRPPTPPSSSPVGPGRAAHAQSDAAAHAQDRPRARGRPLAEAGRIHSGRSPVPSARPVPPARPRPARARAARQQRGVLAPGGSSWKSGLFFLRERSAWGRGGGGARCGPGRRSRGHEPAERIPVWKAERTHFQ